MKIAKFDIILTIWISIVISIVMSAVLPVLAIGWDTVRHFFFQIFIKGFLISFPLSTLFVLFVPVQKLAGAFASALKAKPMTIPFHLLSTIVTAICVGTLMSFVMIAVNAPPDQILNQWLPNWPKAIVVVYISALIGVSTGIPLTKKICGIPGGPPPAGAH